MADKKIDYKKELSKLFEEIKREAAHSSSYVWDCLMTAISCAIANSCTPKDSKIYNEREEMYKQAVKIIDFEKSAKFFNYLISALDGNTEQDLLGDIYMLCGISKSALGQVFTPYHISSLMAQLTINDAETEISKNGYITINDCCCGAGSLLIGAVNTLAQKGINYSHNALVVGCDKDDTACKMAYIQLSLLGVAGYIVRTDTLTNPLCYSDTNDIIPIVKEGQEIWYTPVFALDDVWSKRVLYKDMLALFTEMPS